MSWNYRVIKTTRFVPSLAGDVSSYAIHEVYYDKKTDLPTSWSEDPMWVAGDELEGMKWTLDAMREALEKPVLEITKDTKLTEAK